MVLQTLLTPSAAFGMQFFWGTFLCDLTHSPSFIEKSTTRPHLYKIVSTILIIIGLTLASYPEGEPQRAGWSTALFKLSLHILPPDADIPRFFSGLGLEFVSLGIVMSPRAKTILSSKYLLWLGKNSFAVYLLHGTMLRVVLGWMYFGVVLPAEVKNDQGDLVPGRLDMPGKVWQAVATAIWLPMLYVVANWWTVYVDPMCARWTVALEKKVWEEWEKGGGNGVLLK